MMREGRSDDVEHAVDLVRAAQPVRLVVVGHQRFQRQWAGARSPSPVLAAAISHDPAQPRPQFLGFSRVLPTDQFPRGDLDGVLDDVRDPAPVRDVQLVHANSRHDLLVAAHDLPQRRFAFGAVDRMPDSFHQPGVRQPGPAVVIGHRAHPLGIPENYLRIQPTSGEISAIPVPSLHDHEPEEADHERQQLSSAEAVITMANSRIPACASVAALTAVTHHLPTLAIGAITLILTMLIPVAPQILNEMFWLRALNRPERNLRQILVHASIPDAEPPMRMLRRARGDVLRARAERPQSPLNHRYRAAGSRIRRRRAIP
ncbi:hypothetical protein [Nocardia sp. NPDC057030]|uniref:hypothetical protein n=1 Tax=unclassified Nocardia TaxID=2637762 RepID=UPI003630E646